MLYGCYILASNLLYNLTCFQIFGYIRRSGLWGASRADILLRRIPFNSWFTRACTHACMRKLISLCKRIGVHLHFFGPSWWSHCASSVQLRSDRVKKLAFSKQPRYLTDDEKRLQKKLVGKWRDLAVIDTARRRWRSESTKWDAIADPNNERCGFGRKASLDESS